MAKIVISLFTAVKKALFNKFYVIPKSRDWNTTNSKIRDWQKWPESSDPRNNRNACRWAILHL